MIEKQTLQQLKEKVLSLATEQEQLSRQYHQRKMQIRSIAKKREKVFAKLNKWELRKHSFFCFIIEKLLIALTIPFIMGFFLDGNPIKFVLEYELPHYFLATFLFFICQMPSVILETQGISRVFSALLMHHVLDKRGNSLEKKETKVKKEYREIGSKISLVREQLEKARQDFTELMELAVAPVSYETWYENCLTEIKGTTKGYQLKKTL